MTFVRIPATAASVVAMALTLLGLPLTQASAATVLQVSPAGAGSSCTSAAPCSLDTALSRAESGSSIKLATGNYGSVVLKAKKPLATIASNVVVSPASPSSTPTFTGLDTYAAHVTWTGITVTGPWFLRADAVGSRVEQSHVDGGGLFLRTKDATVRNSLFENGSSIDGIQVGGATNALIENNVIRNYDQSRDNGLHADCIQVFESDDITIRANRLSNCYNSGLILSVGGGEGIHGLLIESNFIQGCIVKSDLCRGGSATDLREQSTEDLTVRNNTITNGSMRLSPVKNLIFDRNIVEYMAACDSPMTNSIIAKWNTGLCKNPPIVTMNGNRVGSPTYVDKDAGDLRILDAASARITSVYGTGKPATRSVDGTMLSSSIAGASDPTNTTPSAADPVDSPEPTPSPSATPYPTPSATPAPSATPYPTPSASPYPTPSASPTPSPTPTRSPTPTPTPTRASTTTPPTVVPSPAPIIALHRTSIKKLSVSPTKVVKKRTKAYITLSVSGGGALVNGGKVTLRQSGQSHSGTVKNGRVRIRLGTFSSSGAQKVTAIYSGSGNAAGSSTTFTVNVRR